MQDNKFEGSDGWLFYSLVCIKSCIKRSGKLNLSNIISKGAMLTHAIFTYEELNNGLSRLESGDYIVVEDRKFKFTQKAKQLIKANRKFGELPIPKQLKYQDIFKKLINDKEFEMKQYFSLEEYNRAVDEYVNNIWLGLFC